MSDGFDCARLKRSRIEDLCRLLGFGSLEFSSADRLVWIADCVSAMVVVCVEVRFCRFVMEDLIDLGFGQLGTLGLHFRRQ